MNPIDALITVAVLGMLGMIVYLSWQSLKQDGKEEGDEEL